MCKCPAFQFSAKPPFHFLGALCREIVPGVQSVYVLDCWVALGMSADLSGFLWPFHLQSAFLRRVQQCPLKQCFDSSPGCGWLLLCPLLPSDQGLSSPAQAKMWMHYCWRSMDTENLISASLWECSSVGLWKVSGKKSVFSLNCACGFFSPSLCCLYRGKPGQVFVFPSHHPNCLEVPKQIRVRAALWPRTVPVRSSLCPLPGATAYLFFGTHPRHLAFLSWSYFPLLFVCVSFSAFQVLLCSLIAPEVRQMDWFL